MGDAEGQSRLTSLVMFLDENHCRNSHLLAALRSAGIPCEKHLDHFAAGTEDTEWLPVVGRSGWCLLTTDARIKTNYLERECVQQYSIRMFYFSRNNLSGVEMGAALTKAIPAIRRLYLSQRPPFTASITRCGEVTLRHTFG